MALIAVVSGEARVTMPLMTRAALVLLIALSVGACTAEEPSSEPSAETTEALTALDDRVADLEADLLAARDQEAKLDERLETLGDRLERALGKLKGSLASIRSGSAEARESAAAALSAAHAAASDLSVLEKRYEYHLRRYHGGNG